LPPPAAGPRTGRPGGPSPSSPTAAPSGGPPEALPPSPLPPAPEPGSAAPEPPPSGPSPLAARLTLPPAPFGPGDVRFAINLATALRLSDARPLVVAAAQARTWVAEAELTRAKLLWVPALNIAADYLRHDGGGPDFNKGLMTAPSVNYFYAGAAFWGLLPMTDALFEPLVARQVLNSRQFDVQTAKNDALLQTADAYFQVHQSRGTYAGALYTVGRARDVAGRVAELGRDLAPAFEVDRARNMLADLEQQAAVARQQWRVHSARLTRVLRLDPRAVVEPLEHDHAQITLVDPGRPLDDLMPVALTNRPEVAAAEVAVRREKARPFIPNVVLNGFQTPYEQLQGGIFGMGPNSSLNQWRGRDDVSIQLIWQLESLGIGNLARVKAQRGLESQAIVDLRRAQDTVGEEVTAAHARVQSAAVRVVQAERALRTGIITLNGTIEGLEQTSRFGDVLVLVSRPQEAVYALQLLQRAFDEYFTTVAEYNRAQFALFRALGYPAAEVARLRPPGEVLPVDLARPAYLPPVGNGPPPATR
jgi:outer membrane protein TolC